VGVGEVQCTYGRAAEGVFVQKMSILDYAYFKAYVIYSTLAAYSTNSNDRYTLYSVYSVFYE
jgi:hypothetical protein